MLKILKLTASILIIILGILLIGTSLPIPGAYKLLSVQSGSMEPAIRTGSIAIIKPSETYREGDILTFGERGSSTTHRIHSIQPDGGIITKGDANEEPDLKPVAKEDVQGKVQFSLPFLGYLVNLLRTPQGFVFLIIIPGTLLVYEEIKNLKRNTQDYLYERKKKRNPTIPTLVFLFLIGIALSHVTQTQAFFSDAENSQNNSFTASHTYATLYDSSPFSCQDGATKREDPDGLVTFIFDTEKVNFKVTITAGTPNSTYAIWVNQHPGACPLSSPTFPAGITTNDSGFAQKMFSTNRQIGANRFWISAVGGGQVLRSTAIEE